MTLDEIINETNTYYCLECGKCSSICPISRYNPDYSPRVMVENALVGLEGDLVYNRDLFSCLTCNACQLKCPSDVDYPLFIQKLRTLANGYGEQGQCAHSGTLQALARIMADSSTSQKRLDWLTDDIRTSDTGDVLYFVGCAPYFENAFDFEARAIEIARNSLRILNHLDIEPRLLPDEKCCGHDAFWMGDMDTFQKLAEHNAEIIKEAGIKTIVFSCPEGYRTFKEEYPKFVTLDCEIRHISEVIAEAIDEGKIKFNKVNGKVTYHDPCRLGRHEGIYDAPRKVIQAIPGTTLIEMPHNKEESICCGTSAFMNCDLYSKQIRIERLNEAKETGAQTMITACPKCQLHFRCTMINKGEEKGPDVEMEVQDLVNLVAKALEDNKNE